MITSAITAWYSDRTGNSIRATVSITSGVGRNSQFIHIQNLICINFNYRPYSSAFCWWTIVINASNRIRSVRGICCLLELIFQLLLFHSIYFATKSMFATLTFWKYSLGIFKFSTIFGTYFSDIRSCIRWIITVALIMFNPNTTYRSLLRVG